jgi:hypothetical protein
MHHDLRADGVRFNSIHTSSLLKLSTCSPSRDVARERATYAWLAVNPLSGRRTGNSKSWMGRGGEGRRTLLEKFPEINLDVFQSLPLRLVDAHCPCQNQWKLRTPQRMSITADCAALPRRRRKETPYLTPTRLCLACRELNLARVGCC